MKVLRRSLLGPLRYLRCLLLSVPLQTRPFDSVTFDGSAGGSVALNWSARWCNEEIFTEGNEGNEEELKNFVMRPFLDGTTTPLSSIYAVRG